MSSPVVNHVPPKKRARSESNPSHYEAAQDLRIIKTEDLRQHAELWYEDGNVILAAQAVAFRVHISVLSRQSAALKELVTSDNHSKTRDDCPVVRVPDSALDWANLLSVLYDSKKYRIRHERAPFPLVASLARLAHKYNIEDLRSGALARIRDFFPDTFDAWTKAAAVKPAEAITAVNLARLTNTPSIIPSALYECSRMEREALVKGVVQADGTVERLSQDDVERCLKGADRLLSANQEATEWIFDLKCSSGCTSKDVCRGRLRQFPREAHRHGVFNSALPLEYRMDDLDAMEDLCPSCEEMIITTSEGARHDVWAMLPVYMSVCIEDWDM